MPIQEASIPEDSFMVLAERDQRHLTAMYTFQARMGELKAKYGGYGNIPGWLRTQACNILRSAGWRFDPETGWHMIHNSVTLSSF